MAPETKFAMRERTACPVIYVRVRHLSDGVGIPAHTGAIRDEWAAYPLRIKRDVTTRRRRKVR